MTEPVPSSVPSPAPPSPMRRLHPLSLAFEVASTLRSNIFPTVLAIFGTARGGWVGLSIGFVVIVGCLTIALIRYFTFRYTIANNELIVDQGLLQRLHRVVPLDRIQNIDLSQNLFHRLMRVGEVRVETASGKEPEAIMRVLAISEFERLKGELLAARNFESTKDIAIDKLAMEPSMIDSSTIENAVEHIASNPNAKRLVLTLPTRLIALGGLLSNRGEVIAGLALGFLWELKFGNSWFRSSSKRGIEVVAEGESAQPFAASKATVKGYIAFVQSSYGSLGSILVVAIVLLLLFALLRAFSAIWYVLRFYGYRLESNGESLQVRCGLLTQVSATIPLGRVQLISIQRTWLQRRFGLASIRIETAGGGESKSENAASSVGRKWFVPIVQFDQLHDVLSAIDPRARIEEGSVPWQDLSKHTLSRMMRPIAIATIILVAAGIWFHLIWGWIPGIFFGIVGTMCVIKKSKSKRYARTAWGIVFKSGTWTQKCSMTFFEKIQGVSYTQSPFDRRWGMAKLSIDTASAGPADHRISVGYLTNDFAVSEFDVIRTRLES